MKFFHFDISVTNNGASGYFFRSISGPAHIQWTLPHPLQDWYSATLRRFRCIVWSFISPPHEQYIYSLFLLIYRFSSSQPAIATRTLVQYRRISRGRLSLSRILLTAAARRLRSFSGVISVPCRGNSCTGIQFLPRPLSQKRPAALISVRFYGQTTIAEEFLPIPTGTLLFLLSVQSL